MLTYLRIYRSDLHSLSLIFHTDNSIPLKFSQMSFSGKSPAMPHPQGGIKILVSTLSQGDVIPLIVFKPQLRS